MNYLNGAGHFLERIRSKPVDGRLRTSWRSAKESQRPQKNIRLSDLGLLSRMTAVPVIVGASHLELDCRRRPFEGVVTTLGVAPATGGGDSVGLWPMV